MELTDHESGTVLFAGSLDNLSEAREYCAKNNLGAELVKIVKRENALLVVLR